MFQKEMLEFLKSGFLEKYKRSAMFFGSPGIGKSQMAYQFADWKKVPLIEMRGTWLQDIDLMGFPMPNIKTGEMKFLKPALLPQTPAVLFIDEINTTGGNLQALLYQVVLDRKFGTHPIHPDTIIIAAGNKSSDGAVAFNMSSALRNRFVVFELEPRLDDFIDFWIDKGYSAEIPAFLKFRPEFLLKLDKNKSFPSPRSWEMTYEILSMGYKKEMEHEGICGCVGEGAAVEFSAFLRTWRDLPDPQEILKNPESFEMPKKAEIKYAIMGALSRHVNKNTIGNFFKYIGKFDAEFTILGIKLAKGSYKEITNSPEFLKWAIKNQDVLI